MRVITFPYAGGNKYSYNCFSENLSEEKCSMIQFEYSGRGVNYHEKLLNSSEEIIENLLVKLILVIKGEEDYIIYGHSMGALIGYLICQKVEELGLRKPQKLIVSGKKSPCIEKEVKLAHLPDEEFWQEVKKLGGIPEELQNYPELIDFFTPILKADFTVVENYKYMKKEKLTIPIHVFYGSEEASEEDMIGWKEETTKEVSITKMEGNHFFIYRYVDFFVNLFQDFKNYSEHKNLLLKK